MCFFPANLVFLFINHLITTSGYSSKAWRTEFATIGGILFRGVEMGTVGPNMGKAKIVVGTHVLQSVGIGGLGVVCNKEAVTVNAVNSAARGYFHRVVFNVITQEKMESEEAFFGGEGMNPILSLEVILLLLEDWKMSG